MLDVNPRPPHLAPARPGGLLVVDGDREIRRLTAIILADAGYRVETAAGEGEALALLAAGRYALILLDTLDAAGALAPGRWAAPERVRAAGGGAPTVLFTAHPPAAFAGWRARGFAGFVAKPYDIADLLAAVAAALRAGPRAVAPTGPGLAGEQAARPADRPCRRGAAAAAPPRPA